MRSGRGCAALVLAAGLALAACSGGDTAPTGTGSLGSTADINEHSRDDIRDGGDLRLAMTSFPANWNTLQIDGNDGEVADMIKPLMPRSFETDAAGNLSIDHDFFTDVQMTSTSPQVVSYTINPKAVWSDGSPITWEDIAAQANALSGKDKRFLIAISNGFDRVAKVERGADDRQAIITFDKPYADWKGQFAGNSMLYPKQVTTDPDAFNTSEVNAIGLTSGPFVVRSADRTGGLITLARNPKWWGDQPKLDTMVYRVLDSNAWTQALQNKEVDAVLLRTIDDLQNVRAVPDLTIRHAPLNRWRHFTFNGAPGSILADSQLRVAISKAIDRQRIADLMQNGLTAKPEPLNNHIFLRGQRGYQNNSLGFDPDAAAKELDALGWTRDGTGRVKDGKRLVIRDVMYNDDTWVQIAKLIQQDLGKVGVELTIDTRPGNRYFADVIQPGDFDVCQFVFQGDAFPYNGIPQIYGYYPDNLQANFGRIGSPELNDLIDKTLSELDPEKAVQLANQVDRKVFEEGHSLPLIQNEGNYGTRSDLANYGAPGLASYDYTKIGYLK
ncbi:ABC transporter family substrate-binding protein [Nocardia sp. SYP-A9097]|uniref:ABC transporter family substrate-binding protein n=1 Tax=Nocardia sp. SYP-A9097 TaxID=2663237 RepID=UPI00129BFA22|nr:ABC transporter family substrate-binding protein [Nocardia sp. SYP-A9097]MRH86204.1 ABC transporter family substrate-binding protein [Nocardia sp. SYP-A9097]